jgi:predicted DNA-binding protein
VKILKNEKANEQVTIRVTEELKTRLESEAKAQGRPLANYIKAIINEHIESQDRAKKIAERR